MVNDAPETEMHSPPSYAIIRDGVRTDYVPADFARKLERERNEAREAFAIATNQCVSAQTNLREAMKIADAMHLAMCAGAFDDGASVLFRKLQERVKEAP
jgi:hypothetical protein